MAEVSEAKRINLSTYTYGCTSRINAVKQVSAQSDRYNQVLSISLFHIRSINVSSCDELTTPIQYRGLLAGRISVHRSTLNELARVLGVFSSPTLHSKTLCLRLPIIPQWQYQECLFSPFPHSTFCAERDRGRLE